MKKTNLTTATLQELCFPVELRDETMACNKDCSKMVIGTIDGVETKLNQMSDVYALIPNEDIFPPIEKIFNDANIKFTVKYSHIEHARFYADYTIEDNGLAHQMKGTNDTIKPMLRVRHSYNGKTNYSIMFGYFRLVCSNGLVIPLEEMKEFNLSLKGKHTESIQKSLEQLKLTLDFFVLNYDKINNSITAKYETLGSRVLSTPEMRIESVLKANSINIIDNSKFSTLNHIMNTIRREANLSELKYKGKVNDWLVYNGINQYLNDNDRNRMAPDVRETKDRSVFEYMLKNEPIAA